MRQEHMECRHDIVGLMVEPSDELTVVLGGAEFRRDVRAPRRAWRIAVAAAMRQEGGDTPAHEERGGAGPTGVLRALRNSAAMVGDHAGEGAGARRTVEISDELQIGAPKPDLFRRDREIDQVAVAAPVRL